MPCCRCVPLLCPEAVEHSPGPGRMPRLEQRLSPASFHRASWHEAYSVQAPLGSGRGQGAGQGRGKQAEMGRPGQRVPIKAAGCAQKNKWAGGHVASRSPVDRTFGGS